MADGMMGTRMTDENTSGVLPAGGKHRRRVGPTRRPEHRSRPLDHDPVAIELSKAQVDQVIRAAGEGGTMSVLLSALKDPQWTLAVDSDSWSYPVQMEDRRLSRSLLSGLLVLSCFSADGGSLGIAELARRLDMNTSTTHRYVTTLLAVGLLERDATTRRYRLAA
jgi:hypothetical protein